MTERRAVIVGAGFGGLRAARRLANVPGLAVTVIDRRNHHLFQPLLYQVAMAALSPADIASPIRSILRKARNVDVVLGEVTAVDFAARRVTGDFGERSWDWLVLACGSRNSWFGHDEWAPLAPGLKTLEDAIDIRRRMLLGFELAERSPDPARIEELLTFVVVGAGPTGVELAGAVAELSRFTLASDFRHIDPRRARTILVDGGDRVLATFSPKSSERARQDLERLGVTLRLGAMVAEIRANEVVLQGGEAIRAGTILWAAGVGPSELNGALGAKTGRGGRIVVEPDLSLPGHREVFVVGDQAAFEEGGRLLPGLAPVAMQQGRHAARNILADLHGRARRPFRYVDKGALATIGRSKAVAEFRRMRLAGFLAWLAWIFVHIYYLIGFRRRLMVFLTWAWSFATFGRGARLITGEEELRKDAPRGTRG